MTGWLISWIFEALVAVSIMLTAWAGGRRLLGRIWPAAGDHRASCYAAIGLGLGAMVAWVFIIGTLGAIGIPSLGLPLLAGSLLGGFDLWKRWRIQPWRPTRTDLLEGVLLALPLAAGGLWATLPPAFYDALVYHVGLPNLYLASGSLIYPENFSLAGYPQNAELIFTIALAIGGEVAVRLTGFLWTALAAFALRRFVSDRHGRLAGNLTYLLLVSQWFFWFQASFLKVDLIGAFFILAAVCTLLDATESDGHGPWIVGGLLTGLAVGVKFANLLPVGLLALSLPWILGGSWSLRVRRTVVLLSLTVAVASPWMVRNAIHRANPLFPAFYEQLGGTGWDDANAERMRAATGMNISKAPVAIGSRLLSVGWRADYGSGGELSRSWMPLLLLGLLLARRRDTRWLLGLAALSLIVGLALFTSYLRIHASALLLVPVAAATVLDRLRPPILRGIWIAICAVIVLTGLVFSFNMSQLLSDGGHRVFTGQISPHEYLVERLSYAPIARYINDNLDPAARIRIVGSARTAYIHRPCAASYVWDDPWIAALVDPAQTDTAMLAALHAEGTTHLLLDTGEMERLERSQKLYGYSSQQDGRAGIDRFLASLKMEVQANGVYLFSVPSTRASR